MRRGALLLLLAVCLAPGEVWGRPADMLDSALFPGEGGENVLNCTIKPLRVVEVNSPVRGVAAEVLVKPGDVVRAGDPLVQLDAEVAEAEMRLSAARARSDAALNAAIVKRDGLERKKLRLGDAVEARAVSLADYEAAVLELELAKAAVASEQQQLQLAELDRAKAALMVEKSLIRSPVAGVVGEDLIDPGESADNGPLATIYVNRPLRVEVFVPAALLRHVLDRGGFSIRAGDTAGSAVPVTLDYVSQAVDLASNTVSVFFTLDESGILPGSQCVFPDTAAPQEEVSDGRLSGRRFGPLFALPVGESCRDCGGIAQ